MIAPENPVSRTHALLMVLANDSSVLDFLSYLAPTLSLCLPCDQAKKAAFDRSFHAKFSKYILPQYTD